MIMTTGIRLALAAMLAGNMTVAARSAALVDFADQPHNVAISGPVTYAGATFSSVNGLRFFTFPGFTHTALCPHATDACRSPVTIDFASAISNLSFDAYQVDTTGILSISLIGSGGAAAFSITLPRRFGPHRVDLSGYAGLTQVILDGRADEEGLLYDNFQFDVAGGGGGAVPEPASWAMMIAGFGLIGAAMRRRVLAKA